MTRVESRTAVCQALSQAGGWSLCARAEARDSLVVGAGGYQEQLRLMSTKKGRGLVDEIKGKMWGEEGE